MPKLIKKTLGELSYYTGRCFFTPEFLSLMLTSRCNFRCPSCSVWKKNNHQQLPHPLWLDLTKQIKRAFPATTFIEFNGGEALLEKNLALKVIKDLSKKFSNLTLNSNGSLITSEIINELEAAGLSAVKLSLYSLKPEIHNQLRGSEIAFKKAKQALDLLAASNLKTEVGILITRYNINELPELITYLESLNNVSIILQSLDESIESQQAKNNSSNFLPLELWPDKNQTEYFFEWLNDHKRQIKNPEANLSAIKDYYLNPESALSYRCFAGQRNLVIYPNGEVNLCFKGAPIGNIKTQPLAKIINGHQARAERKKIAKCCKYCRIIGCNFSRGLKEFISQSGK